MHIYMFMEYIYFLYHVWIFMYVSRLSFATGQKIV